MLKIKLSDTELKKVLSDHLTVIIDRREKEFSHIEDYFKSKKIKYRMGTNETGDFMAELDPNDIIGNKRPLLVPASIERKGSLSELIGNLKEPRFEDELKRSSELESFALLVENAKFEDVITGNYRSEYKPQSALARLKSWELRYKFSINYVDKETAGIWIYAHLKYAARNALLEL